MNEAYELLQKAVGELADKNDTYNSWQEIEAEGLDYITSEYMDVYSRWTDYYLHVFKKGADLAGVIVGTGKTERQEDDTPDKWRVVEVNPVQKIVYEVKR